MKLKHLFFLMFFFTISHLLLNSSNACSEVSNCSVGDRTYRVYLPNTFNEEDNTGAIVFLHGYRGTAKGTMRNKSLKSLVSKLGVPLIALQSDGPDWNIPNAPNFQTSRNNAELDYMDSVIKDAESRFKIDKNKLLLSGFSSGGMAVWHFACYRGNTFAAFVPFSGTFWGEIPQKCPSGAVNIVHTHGTNDSVVPIEGRRIAHTYQGDVRKAVQMMSELGQYSPIEGLNLNGISCSREKNNQGKILELCLFSGGHSMKTSQIERIWRKVNLN